MSVEESRQLANALNLPVLEALRAALERRGASTDMLMLRRIAGVMNQVIEKVSHGEPGLSHLTCEDPSSAEPMVVNRIEEAVERRGLAIDRTRHEQLCRVVGTMVEEAACGVEGMQRLEDDLMGWHPLP